MLLRLADSLTYFLSIMLCAFADWLQAYSKWKWSGLVRLSNM